MKTKSSKAKGRALQNWVRDTLAKIDVKSRCAVMGERGVDVKIEEQCLPRFPFSVECKNTETINVWSAFEQATNNRLDGTEPLLIIKKNRKKPLAVVDAEFFIRLYNDK